MRLYFLIALAAANEIVKPDSLINKQKEKKLARQQSRWAKAKTIEPTTTMAPTTIVMNRKFRRMPNKKFWKAKNQMRTVGDKFESPSQIQLKSAPAAGKAQFISPRQHQQYAAASYSRFGNTALDINKGSKSFGKGYANPMGVKQPSWKTADSTKVPMTENFDMCLNGGLYSAGLGCLCVNNFVGDFCDECLSGWTGPNCDNPAGLCDITAVDLDCSSRWLFNLTLLNFPRTIRNINLEYNGLMRSASLRQKLVNLPNIETIDLKGNYFARFPLQMLKGLNYLKVFSVASNFLFALPKDMLQYTPNLKIFNIKNNNIRSMEKTFYYKVTKLEVIDVSNNNLNGICKGIFGYQTDLKFVAFNRNPNLPLPLNKWFGECPYSKADCDLYYPTSQYGGPLINMRRRIGAFGDACP